MPRPHKPWYSPERGWWYIRINGKRVGLAKGPMASTKKQAYAEFHRIMSRGGEEPAYDIRVDSLCFEFMSLGVDGLADNTIRWYADHLDSFVLACGTTLACELKPIHVTKWLDSHRWGPSTRAGAITAVKRVFKWAKRQSLIAENPIADLEKPPARKWSHTITPERAREVIESYPEGDSFRKLLEALHGTGCRPAELMELNVSGVDLKAGTLTVKNKTRYRTKEPTRTVYLSPAMVDLFREMVSANPTGLVFRNEDGRPWTKFALSNRFNRLRKKNGFGKEATAKAFRRDFITSALEVGVPIATVAELVGHKSTTMITSVYSQLGERREHLKASAAAVRAASSTIAKPAALEPGDAQDQTENASGTTQGHAAKSGSSPAQRQSASDQAGQPRKAGKRKTR